MADCTIDCHHIKMVIQCERFYNLIYLILSKIILIFWYRFSVFYKNSDWTKYFILNNGFLKFNMADKELLLKFPFFFTISHSVCMCPLTTNGNLFVLS